MDTLSKWMQGNVVWSLAVLEPIAPDVPPSHSPQVEQVLQQYQTVFIDPKALPPSRAHDHHIPLLPNTTQMNSRPYRYSPLHKTEIERQVTIVTGRSNQSQYQSLCFPGIVGSKKGWFLEVLCGL